MLLDFNFKESEENKETCKDCGQLLIVTFSFSKDGEVTREKYCSAEGELK